MTSRQELKARTSAAQTRNIDPAALRLSRFKEKYAVFAEQAHEIRDELMDRLDRVVFMAVENKQTSCTVFFQPQRWGWPVQMLLYGPSKQRNPEHFIGVDFLKALDVPTIGEVIQHKYPGVTVTPLGTRVKISWK
jgi:protein-tyrosine-phosphatase